MFYSFHWEQDCFRAAQIRNIGAIEGNAPASDHDWEEVKRGGSAAIARWIDGQLIGRTCTVVLIGSFTAQRPWVLYEIERSWELGMGVFGIYVHNLLDQTCTPSAKGQNPFLQVSGANAGLIRRFAQAYDPPVTHSKAVYGWIRIALPRLIETAINIRNSPVIASLNRRTQ